MDCSFSLQSNSVPNFQHHPAFDFTPIPPEQSLSPDQPIKMQDTSNLEQQSELEAHMARQKAEEERMRRLVEEREEVHKDGSGRARTLGEGTVVGNIAGAFVSFLASILGRTEQK